MEHFHQPVSPETDWYRERLYRERHHARILGVAISGLGLLLALAALLLAFAQSWGNSILFLFLAFLPLFQGISLLRIGWKPITRQAITHLRRSERAQLFLQAQGSRLPWQYSLWARILEGLLGLFFLLEGSQALLHAFDSFSGVAARMFVWISIGAFLLPGLFLLVDGLYLKPRKTRRFIERSSAELAYRLSMGELLTEKRAETEEDV